MTSQLITECSAVCIKILAILAMALVIHFDFWPFLALVQAQAISQ